MNKRSILFSISLSFLFLTGITGQIIAQPLVFDDMEHADPDGNGWFSFGSDTGGGGYSIVDMDLVADVGGTAALSVGFGGPAGFIGGFGRTNLLDLTGVDHFNFWINPNPDQNYTLEVNLQDDDNGDDAIPNPSADDDEYQFNCVVGPSGPCAVAGGGWQLVSIPFSDFFDDNSFHTGGNAEFDAVPTSAGGNGQLVNIVFAIIGGGTDVNFVTDYWAFSQGAISTSNEDETLPGSFSLSQNYPNPFNPSTNLTFNLPQAEQVNLTVFNLLGQPVATIIDNITMPAGEHQITFDAAELTSGVYLYRLDAGDAYTKTMRMTLVR